MFTVDVKQQCNNNKVPFRFNIPSKIFFSDSFSYLISSQYALQCRIAVYCNTFRALGKREYMVIIRVGWLVVQPEGSVIKIKFFYSMQTI